MESFVSEKKHFSIVDAFMRWSLFDDLHRKRAKKFPIVLPPRIEQFYKPKMSTSATSMTGDMSTTNTTTNTVTTVSVTGSNIAEADNHCNETSVLVQNNTTVSSLVSEDNEAETNRLCTAQNLCEPTCEQRSLDNETTNTQEQLHGDVIYFRIKNATERAALRRRRREQLRTQNNHPQAPVIVRLSRKDWPLCTEGTTLVKYMRHVIAYRIYVSRHPSCVVPTGIVKQTEDALAVITQRSNEFDAKMSANQANSINNDNIKSKQNNKKKNGIDNIKKSDNSGSEAKQNLRKNINVADDNTTKHKKCSLEQTNAKQKYSFVKYVQTAFHYIAKRCVRHNRNGKENQVQRVNNHKGNVSKLGKRSNYLCQERPEEQELTQHNQYQHSKLNVYQGDYDTMHLSPDATVEHTEVLHSVQEVSNNKNLRSYLENQEKQKSKEKEDIEKGRASRINVCYAQAPVTYEEIRQHPQLLSRERRVARWRHLGAQRVASEIIYGVPTMYNQVEETSSQATSFCVKEDDNVDNSIKSSNIDMWNENVSNSNEIDEINESNNNCINENSKLERGDDCCVNGHLKDLHQTVFDSDVDQYNIIVINKGNNIDNSSRYNSNKSRINDRREQHYIKEDANSCMKNTAITAHYHKREIVTNSNCFDINNENDVVESNNNNSTIYCPSLLLRKNNNVVKNFESSFIEEDGFNNIAAVSSYHPQHDIEHIESSSSSSSSSSNSSSFYHTIAAINQDEFINHDQSSHLNESSGNEISLATTTTSANSTSSEVAEELFPMQIPSCRLWHADPHKSLLSFNCDVESNNTNNTNNNNSIISDDPSSTNNIIVSDNSISSGSMNRKNNKLHNTVFVSSHREDSGHVARRRMFAKQSDSLSKSASSKAQSKLNQHFVNLKKEERANDSSNSKTLNADSTRSMNASPLAWCRAVKSRCKGNRLHKSVDISHSSTTSN